MQDGNARRKANAKLLNGDPATARGDQMPELVDHNQRHDQEEQDQEWPKDSADQPEQFTHTNSLRPLRFGCSRSP
jgi:hypothetical protein